MLFQIIMPVFQTKNIFLLCISSLLKTITHQTELIIINDGSSFNCEQAIHENLSPSEKLSIIYLEHSFSHGCSKSINEGLKYVITTSYIVFADSDLIFTDSWQEIVIKTLQDSSIGAISGVFLYPQSEGIQCCGISYHNYLARHVYLNNKIIHARLDSVFDVQATIFAFFATKGKIVHETGMLDEKFFNGYEDIDYQLRIRSKGYRIVTNADLILYHFEKSNGIHRQYLRKQNLGIFWAKHALEIHDDLLRYIKMQLTETLREEQDYILVNMSESPHDSLSVINYLESKLSIYTIMDLSNICSTEHKIWLLELLSSDSYAILKPYIFLCDNFIQLTENYYWFKLRSQYNQADWIVDLCANIIPISLLSTECWPGNKLR